VRGDDGCSGVFSISRTNWRKKVKTPESGSSDKKLKKKMETN
jgi:hypothetical protein